MTRTRAALLSCLSAGLGAVAAGGLRLLDSPSSVAVVAGGAVLLGVSLVVDAVRSARTIGAMDAELRGARKDLRDGLDQIETKATKFRERVDELEIAVTHLKSSADAALRRSHPDLGGAGADGTGRNRVV